MEHITSIDDKIQFTMEDSRSDGSMPFLDILVTPGSDGILSTTVCRKLTHTDLYLQWDSHHIIAAKCSVVNTLPHRARAVHSNQQLLEEEDHLQKILIENKYPMWALNRVKMKIKAPPRHDGDYIRELSRTFGERFRVYLKTPSPIYDHYNTTGHGNTIKNFSIVGREDQNLIRAIKEAIYIRVNNPSLKRNIDEYHLPHIWDEVLLNNSELKLKWVHPGGYSICHMV